MAWRAGVDLNPMDVTDPDDVRWLETLIWPGPRHDERVARLRVAVEIARRQPPRIVLGDLNERLGALAADAPPDATLVVFHTAVLTYLSDVDRDRFVDQVRQLPGHWISQEDPSVVPAIGAQLGSEPPDPAMPVLALDGAPVAYTAPHGGLIHWLPR